MDLELDLDLYGFKMIRLFNQSFWEGNVRNQYLWMFGSLRTMDMDTFI